VTATNQNWSEEIKRRLDSDNACYNSVQNLLASHLLCRNVTIKISKTINLPMVLCGYVTLSLTLREEHRLRVFENRMLRRKCGLKTDEVIESCRKLHNEEPHILYSLPSIIGMIK
jgi:hypothetical protein